jgi:hypothetical protein
LPKRANFVARDLLGQSSDMSFDYNAPSELFLAKRTKSSRENYRRFATAAEAIRYAVEDLRTPRALAFGWRLGMSASTVTKFNDYTKPVTIRCANLSDGAARARLRNETDGAPSGGQSQGKDPRPRISKWH